jgi:hypothetical protein
MRAQAAKRSRQDPATNLADEIGVIRATFEVAASKGVNR